MKKKVEVVTKIKHWCSFCGKSQEEVDHMITGPQDADICDECVMLAYNIIFDAQSKASKEEGS